MSTMNSNILAEKNKQRAELEEAMKNYKGKVTEVASNVRSDPRHKHFIITGSKKMTSIEALQNWSIISYLLVFLFILAHRPQKPLMAILWLPLLVIYCFWVKPNAKNT